MANFKFSPDLFLEVQELGRFRNFLDTDGFRKNILENTVNFGLVKNYSTPAFTNARVERDTDVSGGKTLKVSEIKAINNEGSFIYSPGINNLPLLSDGNWYWVKISHRYTSQEVGTVSLSINGDLVGVGTKFLEVLRGMPNFPARIKFLNATFNTLEYDILEVIDDTRAIIAHPASSGTGVATFGVESDLEFAIVGTFTPGIAVPNDNKYPLQYDSVLCELVAETISNTKPTFVQDKEFYLARVKVSGTDVVIQDKRTNIWETKGSSQTIEIEQEVNPLIGVEAAKWQNLLSPSDKNEVYVAWGMRSQNWSTNTAQNILTLSGSALGGCFKTIDDFANGDFDGWRVYTSNGNHSRVVSSIKQGSAINLTLDVLDVDNYSSDGGVTFGTDYVLVVPDCEEIELSFQAEATSGQKNVDRSFTFPINTLFASCNIEVYGSTCQYNINYRYKTHKAYTEFKAILNDNIGYYSEISFDEKGVLKVTEDRVRVPYDGTLTLTLSPDSYSQFKSKVYLGDLLGLQTIESDVNGSAVYSLRVGIDKKYQYFKGNITLSNNLYISLSDIGAVEGNSFRLHFKCSLTLGNYKIFIVRDYSTGTPVTIKTIESEDVIEMDNRQDGIVIDVNFSDQGKWDTFFQNYDYRANSVLLAGDQTIAGIKTFSDSPLIPLPEEDMQAAPKKYIDDIISNKIITGIRSDWNVSTQSETEAIIFSTPLLTGTTYKVFLTAHAGAAPEPIVLGYYGATESGFNVTAYNVNGSSFNIDIEWLVVID